MPSEAELLSIATLEAMACGLPILAARAQALPELVEEGVNGSLFQPGNPQDAALVMSRLADHPEHFSKMGQASLQKTQAHNLDRVLLRYEQIYRIVTENPAMVHLPSRQKPNQPIKTTHSRAL
jgi:1,2-diacylglycerol 3-alpha-glucosyltransferase